MPDTPPSHRLRPLRQDLQGQPDWQGAAVLPTGLSNDALRQETARSQADAGRRQRMRTWELLKDAGLIPVDKPVPPPRTPEPEFSGGSSSRTGTNPPTRNARWRSQHHARAITTRHSIAHHAL